MATPRTAKEIIKSAKRQRQVHRVNLAGHLVAELQHLQAEYDQLIELGDDAKPTSRRLTSKSPLTLKAEQIAAKRAEMEDSWVEFTLEQQPFSKWRAFKLANPRREDAGFEDDYLRVNFDALVTEFMPTCVVEPDDLDKSDWDTLFDMMSGGDLSALATVAYTLHEGVVRVPLPLSDYGKTPPSGDSSEPREAGE